MSRGVRGLVTGVPVEWTGSRSLLGAAGALGMKPGYPLKGQMRVLSGQCLPPGVWSLGCRDGPFFVCALAGLRHFCCSRRGSCPPSYPFLGDMEVGVCDIEFFLPVTAPCYLQVLAIGNLYHCPSPVWDFGIFVLPRTHEGWRRMGCRGRYKIRSYQGGSECTWRTGLLRSSR